MESFHVCNNYTIYIIYTQYTHPLDPIASKWNETKVSHTCKLRLNTECKFKRKMQHRNREKEQYFRRKLKKYTVLNQCNQIAKKTHTLTHTRFWVFGAELLLFLNYNLYFSFFLSSSAFFRRFRKKNNKNKRFLLRKSNNFIFICDMNKLKKEENKNSIEQSIYQAKQIIEKKS